MSEFEMKRYIIEMSTDFYSAFSLIKQISSCASYTETEEAIRQNALRDLNNITNSIDALKLTIRNDRDTQNSKLNPVIDSMTTCITNIIQVVTEMIINARDPFLRNAREVKLTAFYDQYTCLLPILIQMNEYNDKKMIQVVVDILEKILAKLPP